MSNTVNPPTQPSVPEAPLAASSWGRSARETIESVAIAFALAFLFKTFEAEAFVIPTGSMAPTLMGRHKDVVCPECGYRYSASGSDEADRNGSVKRKRDGSIDESWQVVGCTCPNCRFYMNVDPLDQEVSESPSYSGDRIWVSKVPYHLSEPSRWDVIVFRFPEEAETYYIKRLVGLPNETVRIFHGDIYSKGPSDSDFVLQRKPPDKVRAMAQIVHDSDHVSPTLLKRGWPPRWRAMSADKNSGAWRASDDTRSYSTDGSSDEPTWIRYEHRVPSFGAWDAMLNDRWSPGREPRPQLITDFYAFNTRVLRAGAEETPGMLGLHWVGDLIVDCELDVQGESGEALFELVKAGRHFRAAIDVATGDATLTIDGRSDWRRTAKTSVRGPGKRRVMFANVDRQLILWVDDKVVEFDKPATYDEQGDDHPQAGSDGGDLAPAGIGSKGAWLAVNHLRVLRDIYYIADDRISAIPINDYHRTGGIVPILRSDELAAFFSTPEHWSNPAGSVFDARQEVKVDLGSDQFFVLGDNSPASSDARFWMRGHYVDRKLLIGKALYVYWPHPLDLAIPLTNISVPLLPNIGGMGFIR